MDGHLATEMQQDYDFNQRREDFIAQMRAQGYRIVLPAANELQIDIDDEAQYATYKKSMECLLRNWWAFAEDAAQPEIEEHPSKSGLPSRHITIKLPFDVDPWERIALQAALGSDPLRELLSAVRLRNDDEAPTLFVETGEE